MTVNWMVTSAGLLSAFTTIGHFTIGSKRYLKPMLQTDFDPVARKVMHCVFHYISTFLILSTAALLMAGLNLIAFQGNELLVRFIALNYAGFAIWQLALAFTSEIQNAGIKLFQWIFFVLTAILAWFGA